MAGRHGLLSHVDFPRFILFINKEGAIRRGDTYTIRVPSGERIVSVPYAELSDTSAPRSTSSRTSGRSDCSRGRVARHSVNDVTTKSTASNADTANSNLLVEAGAACVAPIFRRRNRIFNLNPHVKIA